MPQRRGQTIVRFILIGGVCAALAGAGYFLYQRFAGLALTVTEVVEGPVVQAFYATGTLEPEREYPIKSNVEGIVTEVLVDKGDAVAAGQKLAFVRVEAYHMRFIQAKADLELAQQLAADETSPALREFDMKLKAAEEQLRLAQDELERTVKLLESSSATKLEHDRARDRVQTVWSAVEALRSQKAARKLALDRDVAVAQAALDIAQWNLDEQTIRAPVDGVVLDRPLSIGTRVKVNDHLLLMADVAPAHLVMRAAVDEEDKTRVRLGQLVSLTLYAYGGRIFEGRVKQVYPKADPDRRTFEVDIAIEPPDEGFAAGMTGELAFIVESKERATVVPSQAVQAGAIWVVRDGRLERADVRVGLRSIERTEILEGLRPGDRVVISPVGNLAPGRAVRTTFMDPQTAAGLNKPPPVSANFRGFN